MTDLTEASSKWKLLGTSPNLTMMEKLISEYFYGSSKVLKPVNDKEWQVLKSNGEVMKKLRVVIKRGGRLRFEMYTG